MSVERGRVLLPPEIVEVKEPILFLAGPDTDAPDWRSDGIRIVHELDSDIVIASPQLDYPLSDSEKPKQRLWERYNLGAAAVRGAIMFWFPKQKDQTWERGWPRPYGRTSYQELGRWRGKKEYNHDINLIVGIEPGFGGATYDIDEMNDDNSGIIITDNLEETCIEAVKAIRRQE